MLNLVFVTSRGANRTITQKGFLETKKETFPETKTEMLSPPVICIADFAIEVTCPEQSLPVITLGTQGALNCPTKISRNLGKR